MFPAVSVPYRLVESFNQTQDTGETPMILWAPFLATSGREIAA